MVAAEYPLLGGGVPAAVGMGLPLPERMGEPVSLMDAPAGTLTPDFIKRLHDQIAMAEKEMETFRAQNRQRDFELLDAAKSEVLINVYGEFSRWIRNGASAIRTG